MRELNEIELEQVAGGFTFSKGTASEATGAAATDFGPAFSKSSSGAVNYGGFSASWAKNTSAAFGPGAIAESAAASTSGVSASS